MYTFIHHEGSKSTVKNKNKNTDIQYIYNNGLYKKTHTQKINFSCLKHNYKNHKTQHYKLPNNSYARDEHGVNPWQETKRSTVSSINCDRC